MSPYLEVLSSEYGYTAQSFYARDSRLVFGPPELDYPVGFGKSFIDNGRSIIS